MAKLRAFVGSRLDAGATARVFAAATSLRAAADAAGVRASWAPAENLHVTLKFLGDIDEALVPSLESSLAPIAARHAVIDGEVHGVGAFPSPRRPAVLFAAFAGPPPALSSLAADVETACAALGFARETRAYHPHVTLARVKSWPPGLALDALVASLPTPEPARFRIATLTLFRSALDASGARYHPLADIPLGASAGPGGRI